MGWRGRARTRPADGVPDRWTGLLAASHTPNWTICTRFRDLANGHGGTPDSAGRNYQIAAPQLMTVRNGMCGQAITWRPGSRRRRVQPGGTRAAAVSAACGGPAPVTRARTRWHGMRSLTHKTFRRRRRVQSGDPECSCLCAITHFTQSRHVRRRRRAARGPPFLADRD